MIDSFKIEDGLHIGRKLMLDIRAGAAHLYRGPGPDLAAVPG